MPIFFGFHLIFKHSTIETFLVKKNNYLLFWLKNKLPSKKFVIAFEKMFFYYLDPDPY